MCIHTCFCRTHRFEQRQPFGRKHIHVGQKLLLFRQLVRSFVRQSRVLSEHNLVREFLREDVELGVEELTAVAVGTVGSGVELSADLGLEVGRQVRFLHELVLAMCEGALVSELALAADLPVAAHLGLLLHLVLAHEVVALLLAPEVLAGLLKGG